METQKDQQQLNRGEFLRSLGMSSAALMAFYCMGTLTACSSKSSDPTPSTGTGTGTTAKSGDNATVLSGNTDSSKGTINFIIDLTSSANSPLATNGGYMYASDIIVAKTTSGSYVAVSKICTHQQATIIYRSDESDFYCPSHGSRFTETGAVKNAPATTAVKAYKTSLSSDSKQLTVTA